MEERCEERVVDRFDELEDDMTNGFRDLLGKFENMDADGLRREIQMLMMIGHQQMTTMSTLRHELEGAYKDVLTRINERRALVKDVEDIARIAGIPFDPDCDSLHTTLRHVISVADAGDDKSSRGTRVMETVLTVAGVLAAMMLFVFVVIMVAACVR